MSLKRKEKSLSTDEDYQSKKILGEGDSWYEESLFSSNESIEILKKLDEQIVYLPREQFKFKIFNTVNLLPRDKAFYGDVHSDGSYPLYRYETHKDVVYPEVQSWPSELERLRDIVFEKTGQRCNHCVVNQYRDNNDHIGYHFDKTRDFVNNSSVITLSFGGERILRLKHNETNITEDVHFKEGSIFVLGSKTNSIWKHSIIKTKRSCQRRVSLTYRFIKTIKHKDGTLTEIDGSDIPSTRHQANLKEKYFRKTEESHARTEARGLITSIKSLFLVTNNMARAKNRLINGITSVWYRNSDRIGVELTVWGVIIVIIVCIIALCYLRFNEICCYCCRYYKKRSREKTEFRTPNSSLKSTETKTSYENIPLVP